jgi:hypothetical protein
VGFLGDFFAADLAGAAGFLATVFFGAALIAAGFRATGAVSATGAASTTDFVAAGVSTL